MKTPFFVTAALLAGLIASVAETAHDFGQSPAGPPISDLAVGYQDLTYDGLVNTLPPEPAYREGLDFDPVDSRYFENVEHELNLTPETDLKADLHVDSTTAVEVAYRLSRLLDLEIPLERWYVGQTERDNDFTIRVLVAFLRGHLDN